MVNPYADGNQRCKTGLWAYHPYTVGRTGIGVSSMLGHLVVHRTVEDLRYEAAAPGWLRRLLATVFWRRRYFK
jgi:hypothetical protein